MTRRALVCALMPEQDRDSGSRRVLHLIEFLQEEGWAVTVVSHHANPRARYVRDLQQRGIDVYAGSGKWVEPLIATGDYDLAVLGLWEIAEAQIGRIRRLSPETRIVIDSIDFHMLRQARRAFVNGTGLSEAYGADVVRELNTYALADAVLTVSQKEADLINDFVADASLAHAMPDAEELPPAPPPLPDRRGLVFVGCYRFPPNVSAVEHLCSDILPRIDPALLDEHPVHIVGDGLGDDVRDLGRDLPQVRMVGWVPSVAPYLDRARVCVVPLRYGAGTKRKVLDALLHGTPVVSTSVGAEGLGLLDGEHAVVTDDPAAFARGVEALLTDDDLWTRLRDRGRAHIAARHGRDRPRQALRDVLAAVFERPARRLSRAATPGQAPATFTPAEYEAMVDRAREAAAGVVPADAGVIVVSRGDDRLLALDGRSS